MRVHCTRQHFIELVAQGVEVAGDDGEQVVEVVGEAAGELADGFHLLGLDQRGLSRPAACTLGAYEATSEDDAAPGGCQTLPGRHRGPASAGALLALLALAAFASHRRQRTEQG